MADLNITVSTSGDAKGLQTVGDALDNLEGKAGKTSKAFDMFKNSIASAAIPAAAITGGIAAIGGVAIKSAADFEQSRVAFTTMLGSGKKAGELLTEISEFARKTPFELPGVVSSAKQLLAYGFAQKDIIPQMKLLGDVSAGLSIPMGDMAYLYGTLRSQQVAYTKDLNQFTNRGVPIWEELAKVMKMSVPQVKEATEAGAVSFEMVQAAFENMAGPGGKFFNLMDAQSKTLTGTISNLRDNFGRLLRSVVGVSDTGEIKEGSVFMILAKGATQLLQGLDAVMPKIVGFFQFLTENKPVLFALLGAFTGLLTLALLPLVAAFITALPALAAFAVAGAAIGVLANFIMSHWEPIKNFFMNIWNTVTGAFNTFKNTFTNGINYVKDHFFEILGFIIGFTATLPFKLPMYISQAITSMIGIIRSVDWGQAFMSLIHAAGNVAGSVVDAFKRAWQAIKNIDWGGILSGIARGVGNSIIGFIEGAIKGALSGIPGVKGFSLPRFANGVTNFGGGLAVVGERGPELAYLPRGTNVVPNNKIGGAMGGITVHQNNIINREVDMDKAMRELGWQLRLR